MYHDMLKTFREDRGLTEYNHEAFLMMVNQELDEVLEAKTWNHRVEEMCDVCVLCFNAMAQHGNPVRLEGITNEDNNSDVYESVSWARDAVKLNMLSHVIAEMHDCIISNGYNFELAMIETCKKILSRKGTMNNETGKWEKDLMQDKSTLYVPDYESCKVNDVEVV